MCRKLAANLRGHQFDRAGSKGRNPIAFHLFRNSVDWTYRRSIAFDFNSFLRDQHSCRRVMLRTGWWLRTSERKDFAFAPSSSFHYAKPAKHTVGPLRPADNRGPHSSISAADHDSCWWRPPCLLRRFRPAPALTGIQPSSERVSEKFRKLRGPAEPCSPLVEALREAHRKASQ